MVGTFSAAVLLRDGVPMVAIVGEHKSGHVVPILVQPTVADVATLTFPVDERGKDIVELVAADHERSAGELVH